MADKLVPHRDDQGVIRRFKDMGDGTFAEVSGGPAAAAGASGYPPGATPVATSATGANSIATATLPGVAGKTTYLTGLQFTTTGATAAVATSCNITGLLGGTETFIASAPAGATLAAPPISFVFSPPLPAAAVNTAIACSIPALGAGHAGCSISLQGYQI